MTAFDGTDGARGQGRAVESGERLAVVGGAKTRLMQPLERLYHLAEADNFPSIREHGLLSTEKLLELVGMPNNERATWLRQHRPNSIRLSNGILIRDQRPMPPNALAGALVDGLEPADWYALLNRHVFLWPSRDRMERQRNACGDRPQVLLTFDGIALLERYGADALLSPINSGNARRKPALRGRNTLMPFGDWLQAGWPTGQRARPPAEILFRCSIPVHPPYLIEITEL
jgi:hypothetical protein